jgi:hypothetical protein
MEKTSLSLRLQVESKKKKKKVGAGKSIYVVGAVDSFRSGSYISSRRKTGTKDSRNRSETRAIDEVKKKKEKKKETPRFLFFASFATCQSSRQNVQGNIRYTRTGESGIETRSPSFFLSSSAFYFWFF